MEKKSGGQDRRGRKGKNRGDFLYVNDFMVASTDPECLQGASDTLIGLLY